MSVFINDPFDTLAEAFYNLYPDCKYEAFIVSPEMINPDSKAMFGETFFPEDGSTPAIFISPELKIKDAVEIFAHELAHVATPNEEHSTAWEEAFEKIFQEYNHLVDQQESFVHPD